MRLGYACINLSVPTKLRTTRLANATHERVLELARSNLLESAKALRWNAENGIGMMRLTSDMVPFAAHPGVAAPWREALAEDLARFGDVVRATGQRVGTHPGQYTVLNSPRPDVVAMARLDLAYHADMLDLMGVPGDIILHLGGAYGDRDGARARFLEVAWSLPANVRRRLVLENDDFTWNAGETLAMAHAAGLPMVFDVFHHALLPTPDLPMPDALRAALATWPAGRAPKVHYSDPAPPPARRGTHGDTVDPAGFAAFLRATRDAPDFDVMVEAKHKELAVLPLLPRLDGAGRGAPSPAPRRASAA